MWEYKLCDFISSNSQNVRDHIGGTHKQLSIFEKNDVLINNNSYINDSNDSLQCDKACKNLFTDDILAICKSDMALFIKLLKITFLFNDEMLLFLTCSIHKKSDFPPKLK